MNNKYAILRVWEDTAQHLKILAAMQRESMIAVLDRLVTAECERLDIPLDVRNPLPPHANDAQ